MDAVHLTNTYFAQPEGRWRVTLNIGLLNNPWGRYTHGYFAQLIAQGFALRVGGVEDTLVEVAYYDDYARPGEHPRAAHQSDMVTEPTAVVEFDVEPFDKVTFETALAALADTLTQGAIAWTARPLVGRRRGLDGLVGPYAERWGGMFDERHFQPLDATRHYGAHLIERERGNT